jgi:hypothetical protein
LRERGIEEAEAALRFLRYELRKIPVVGWLREQLQFELSGEYLREDEEGNIRLMGWWRAAKPIGMNLGRPRAQWTESLSSSSNTIASLSEPLRVRIENSLWWLDEALRSYSWRTRVLAVFAAIESLLVPEDCGKKAEVLTVRAAALQLAVQKGFTHPFETYNWYMVRCDLVHGSPMTQSPGDIANPRNQSRLETWADELVGMYVRLAREIDAKESDEFVKHLDSCESMKQTCEWLGLLGQSGVAVVDDYRCAVKSARDGHPTSPCRGGI